MKKAILILSIAAALITGGCDNRVDVFANIDTPPVMTFQKESKTLNILSDSIKKKEGVNYYPLVLNINAPTSQVSNLTYEINGQNGHFIYRSFTIKDGKLPTDYQNLNLNFFPDSLGISDIIFTATNRFGKLSSAHAKICYFDNLPPKSVMNITRTTNKDAYEYQIDGSSSFDGDAKFGGYLKGFCFALDNQVIVTQHSSIKYIFPTAGQYTIGLTVTDSNNATHSITQTITVQ
ncbi:PKD domain-containing protein [Mucilaginibacter sp. UYCu711]|uniref:PKD domain-containing protein n=1 Tax=Mucilaginibacter sp. UYCu711 TaxID=3156339 RepID=UPI003D1E2737